MLLLETQAFPALTAVKFRRHTVGFRVMQWVNLTVSVSEGISAAL